MVTGRDLEDVNQISSRQLFDASYLRLKNISLSYRLPNEFLNELASPMQGYFSMEAIY
jgi:hypothetical protein